MMQNLFLMIYNQYLIRIFVLSLFSLSNVVIFVSFYPFSILDNFLYRFCFLWGWAADFPFNQSILFHSSLCVRVFLFLLRDFLFGSILFNLPILSTLPNQSYRSHFPFLNTLLFTRFNNTLDFELDFLICLSIFSK